MHKTSIRNLIKNLNVKVYLIYFTYFEFWKSICSNCENSQIWDIGVVGMMQDMRSHDEILVETSLNDPISSLHNIYSTIKCTESIPEIDEYQRIIDIFKMSSKIMEFHGAVWTARISSIWLLLPRYLNPRLFSDSLCLKFFYLSINQLFWIFHQAKYFGSSKFRNFNQSKKFKNYASNLSTSAFKFTKKQQK